MKEKHQRIISIGVERAPDTIQHPFMIKTIKLRIEVNFLNLINAIQEKPIVTHMDTKGGKPQWGGDGGVLNWAIVYKSDD